MKMPDLPPMPTPADLGITDQDWKNCEIDSIFASRSRSKVNAYNRAVEAWKEVAIAVSSRPDKKIDINRG
jgi:hypothetical protein